MSKGSQTTTQQTQTGPPPNVQAAYNQLISNTQQLAQTPYVPYTGEGVAPVNAQQQQGIGNINQYALSGIPLYQQAAGLIGGAAQPLNPTQIQQYYSPYQNAVIGTTEEQFNQMNKAALNNIQGNAAVQGALGGDRSAVADAAYYQGVLPGQEQAIAGLENTGYANALATAAQQFQQNPLATAFGLGNVALGQTNTALQGAGAQVGAGTLEQQTSQALDQYLYNQYLAQQGFPFMENQYATANIGALGSLSGGTSYGTTTAPAPSVFAQLLGLGTAGAGAYGAYQSAQNKTSAAGGRVKGYQAGGSPTMAMPYAGGPSYLPTGLGLPLGPGPPGAKAPTAPGTGQGASNIFGNATQLASMGKMGQGIGSALGGLGGAGAPLDIAAGTGDATAGLAAGDMAAMGAGDLTASDAAALFLLAQGGGRINYPGGLALPGKNRIQMPMRGGMGMPSFVRGYQGGGSPNFEQEFGDTLRKEQLVAQEYGINPSNFSNPNVPVSVSPEGGFGELADLQAPQSGATAYTAAGSPLAFVPGQPTGGLQAPSSETYQPSLPPRMAPSTRPQTVPGQGGQGFLGMSPEFWSSLIPAGLGMMAAARPGVPTGVAIGQGGLEGFSAYGSMKKGEADIEMQARKLDQAAQAEQDRIAHEGAVLAETAKYHGQELGLRQRGLEQELWAPFTDISGNTRFFNKKTGEIKDTPPYGAPTSAPTVPTAPPTAAPPGPAVSPSTPTSAAEPQQKPVQIASQETNGVLADSYDAQPASIKTPTHPELQHRDEAFLQTLDPSTQALVKGVADYKINPAQLSYRDKTTVNRLISRYDPDWSQVRYNTIAKAMPNFTGSGVEARNMTSQDMAMQHIGSALDNIRTLDQGNFVWKNAIANAIKGKYDPTTQSALGKIGTDVQAIQNELTTAFRGSGHPSEQEALQWSKKIDYNNPAGLRGALQEAASLLAGRITAAGSRYNDAVGDTYARDPASWMSTKGRAAYNRASSMDPVKGEGPAQAGQPAAQPSGAGVDPRDAQALRANASNPAAAAAIDKKYGAGTAARLLGTQ